MRCSTTHRCGGCSASAWNSTAFRAGSHGSLRAVGIAATSYEDGESVTYYDTVAGIEPWRRAYRRGVRTPIALDHVMASLAIPFLFRPVRLADGYYGDGAMRQTSPLGSAVHLGAERLLVIGVAERHREAAAAQASPPEPSYGRMFGFMLDSLFSDHVDADVERIALHNRTPGVRPIALMIIRPSRPLMPIARRHIARLPRSLRILLRTIGAGGTAGTQLMSYLMFESAFTRDLIALGVADALACADELSRFLGFDAARP